MNKNVIISEINKVMKSEVKNTRNDIKKKKKEIIELAEHLSKSGNLNKYSLIGYIINSVLDDKFNYTNGVIDVAEEVRNMKGVLVNLPITALLYISNIIIEEKLKLKVISLQKAGPFCTTELRESEEYIQLKDEIDNLAEEEEKAFNSKMNKNIKILEEIEKTLTQECFYCGGKLTSTGQCTNMNCKSNTTK